MRHSIQRACVVAIVLGLGPLLVLANVNAGEIHDAVARHDLNADFRAP